MKITFGAPFLLFLWTVTLAAPPPERYPVDWKAVLPEIMEHTAAR